MALENNWIRGRPSKGLRQINIRYQIEEDQFKEIEDLLERVPHKKVNEIMRYALLVGCRWVLSSADKTVEAMAKTPNSRGPNKDPVVIPSAPPPSPPVKFGKASQGMFDSYGGDASTTSK